MSCNEFEDISTSGISKNPILSIPRWVHTSSTAQFVKTAVCPLRLKTIIMSSVLSWTETFLMAPQISVNLYIIIIIITSILYTYCKQHCDIGVINHGAIDLNLWSLYIIDYTRSHFQIALHEISIKGIHYAKTQVLAYIAPFQHCLQICK